MYDVFKYINVQIIILKEFSFLDVYVESIYGKHRYSTLHPVLFTESFRENESDHRIIVDL